MRPQATVLAAAFTLLASASSWADYKDSYKQGVEAVEKSRWAEAARLMQAAIAGKSAEGETIRFYGQRFETYLPHYYLGLALYNSGDCEGALRAWATSEGQGAVRKSDQYRTLTKNRDACQTKLATGKPATPKPPAGPDPAAVAQATQGAESALGRADEASRAVASLQTDPLIAPMWAQDAALGPAFERAKDTLASARGKLDTGRKKPDLVQLAEARDLGGRAEQQLEAIRSHATQKRDEARRVAEAKAAAEKAAATKPLPVTPTQTQTGPPAELVAAARAFFGAQYQQAADLLDRADGFPGRAGAHGLAFRAAARHALYLIGGEKDTSLLSSAQADVRASRRLDPSLRPDPNAFSPRFIEFYRSSR